MVLTEALGWCGIAGRSGGDGRGEAGPVSDREPVLASLHVVTEDGDAVGAGFVQPSRSYGSGVLMGGYPVYYPGNHERHTTEVIHFSQVSHEAFVHEE